MEKRIELEKRGRPAEEIKELNLDNCRATQIEGLTEEFKILASLSLINVGLTTLKGFPSLPNLRKLELSDNRISGSLNLLSGCPKLEYLNLSGNKIKDIATLEPLKNFKCVLTLDLFNCEVTNVESYREKVFELLEGLQYLDGFDRNNQEAEDEEEDGEDVDGEDDDDDEEDDDDDDDEVVCVLSDDEEEDGIVEVDEECDDEEGDDDDEADDDDDEEDDEEVGLDYLEKENLDDESEGEEFAPGDAHEEEDVDEDGADADAAARGVKRKHDEEEEDS